MKSSAGLPEESDDDTVEDKPSGKKISLAEVLKCAESLLDLSKKWNQILVTS